MGLDFNLNLAGDTPEGLDSPDGLPLGWHPAVLKDVYEDRERQGVIVFQYEGTSGPLRGRPVYDRLTDPEYAESDGAREFFLKRMKTLARRLGLVSDQEVNAQQTVKKSWYDAIGKRVVIHVEENSYKDKKTDVLKTRNQVAPFGVYPLDYPAEKLPKSCPPDVRALFAGKPGRPADGPDGPDGPAGTTANRPRASPGGGHARTPEAALAGAGAGFVRPADDVSDL
jgi:hypothetical protein